MKLVSPAAVSAFFLPLALGGTEDIAYCDGCWCIPEAGESCPADYVPQIDFTDEFLSNLQNFALENPMQLSCDPYQEENCDTQPPLEDGAACVAEITRPEGDADCPSEGYSYRLKTVPSRAEAEKNGEMVTHEGACGTCSTFKDLSVYMSNPNLAEVGIRCAVRAILNFTDGVTCYMDEGFTEPCATIWIYNSFETRVKCPMCTDHAFSGAPNNGPPPTCQLAECLQCDEDIGRTRRGSGLLSAIVRPCSSIPFLEHHDPCDFTNSPTLAPSEESSGSSTASRVLWLVLSIIYVAV